MHYLSVNLRILIKKMVLCDCTKCRTSNAEINAMLFFFFVFWFLFFFCLFIVLRPAQEIFTYMGTSPLPVKGCKI
jgi:hypothetical protein